MKRLDDGFFLLLISALGLLTLAVLLDPHLGDDIVSFIAGLFRLSCQAP